MTLPTETVYYMRAYDDGTMGKVYWTTTDQYATPASGDTQPNYTGTLSAIVIVFSKVREIVSVATESIVYAETLPVITNTQIGAFAYNTIDLTLESIAIGNYTVQTPPG